MAIWNSYSKSVVARQALDDSGGANGGREINEQVIEADDLDIGELRRDLAGKFDALVEREKRSATLALRCGDADDDLVGHAARASNDVQVAKGDGVKGSGNQELMHA